MDRKIEKIGAFLLFCLTIYHILIAELLLAKILIIMTFVVFLIIWKLICISLKENMTEKRQKV